MHITTLKRWSIRLSIIVVLLALLAAAAWWATSRWAPSRDDYPVQGLYVTSVDGALSWPTLAVMGSDFAYVRASAGGKTRDSRFAANIEAARNSGMRYGAVHEFSLCDTEEEQAEMFITTVPRDPDMLPPVISLAFDEEACKARPDRAMVLSELNTFLNQIESHSEKPALLRISADFEEAYVVSDGLSRTVWLIGDFFPPDYAAKSWVMWQANSRYRIKGAPQGVRWNVVRQ
ncbi:glycoside hydrolase family 25 protein [Blastomonas sp.]|uniref:glycoside hydrolase family 25 protein n=1 Tax=Blastomonas sp. TaxID=1909299 RepID=UPI0035939817